jgi:hypothetical protein
MLVLFFKQPRTEKQKAIVASAEDGYARNATITSNIHNTATLYSHFCSELYILVLKNFEYFTLYSSMGNEKFE